MIGIPSTMMITGSWPPCARHSVPSAIAIIFGGVETVGILTTLPSGKVTETCVFLVFFTTYYTAE